MTSPGSPGPAPTRYTVIRAAYEPTPTHRSPILRAESTRGAVGGHFLPCSNGSRTTPVEWWCSAQEEARLPRPQLDRHRAPAARGHPPGRCGGRGARTLRSDPRPGARRGRAPDGPAGCPRAATSPSPHHAKKAMERSLREALKLGDRSIASAHLMLGVLEVEGCLGLQIVADVSDDVDEIKSWLKENRRIRTEPDRGGRADRRRSGMRTRLRPMRHADRSPDRSGAPSVTGTSGRSRRAWPAAGVAICSVCVEAAADRLLARPSEAGDAHPRPAAAASSGLRRSSRAGADAVAGCWPPCGPCGQPPTSRPRRWSASMEDGADARAARPRGAAGATPDRSSLVIRAVRFRRPRTTPRSATRSSSAAGRGCPSRATSFAGTGAGSSPADTIVRLLGRSGTHPPPPPP